MVCVLVCKFPKHLVPEKLRKLLQETEKDAAGHVEVIKEKKEKLPPRSVGRPRKNPLAESPVKFKKEGLKVRKSVEIQTSPLKEVKKSPKHSESTAEAEVIFCREVAIRLLQKLQKGRFLKYIF